MRLRDIIASCDRSGPNGGRGGLWPGSGRRGEGSDVQGWGLLLAALLVCLWIGITALIVWLTGRWPRQL
jgi:hypothetical protein